MAQNLFNKEYSCLIQTLRGTKDKKKISSHFLGTITYSTEVY